MSCVNVEQCSAVQGNATRVHIKELRTESGASLCTSQIIRILAS